MAQTRIIFTPKAEEGLQEIFDYLAAFSLPAAELQIDRILDKINLLRQFPRMGRVVEHFEHPQIRELPIGAYLVAYYIVSEQRIDILSVHHSSRPPDALSFSDDL